MNKRMLLLSCFCTHCISLLTFGHLLWFNGDLIQCVLHTAELFVSIEGATVYAMVSNSMSTGQWVQPCSAVSAWFTLRNITRREMPT